MDAEMKKYDHKGGFSQEEKEIEHDQVLSAIGIIGRWQWKYFALLCVVGIPTAFPTLVITFLNAKTDFWCARPADLNDPKLRENWRELSSPLVEKAGESVRDQCHVWDTNDYLIRNPLENDTKPCTAWEYNRTSFPNTLTQEFDLVCDRSYLVDLSQSIFFAGLLIGVVGAGWLADFIGRKKALFPLTFGMSLFGILSAFMPSFEAFMVIRFFQATCMIGVFTVAFVWVMETVGGKWQTIIGIGFETPWVIGWFLLALLAYIFPRWDHLLLACSIPTLATVVALFFVPESPKWLLSIGKVDEASKIVRVAAEYNGRTLAPDWQLTAINHHANTTESKANILHLFMHKNLAAKTLIIYFNWFANSFVYYGLTLNSSLTDAIMLNFLLNGLMEIPGYLIAGFVLLKRGRKVPYVAMMIIGGTALFCTLAVPKTTKESETSYEWIALALALLGKLMITGTFGIAYVYSAEIYPTVVRSIGVGSSSMFARIGGMVAPIVGSLAEDYGATFPISIFGLTAFVAGILALLLPETQNRKLPDTIEEGETIKIDWRDGLFAFNESHKE